MKGFLKGLVLGIILGAVGYWFAEKRLGFFQSARGRGPAGARWRYPMENTARSLGDSMRATLEALQLRGDQISDELAKNREIVRRKAKDIGNRAVNAASDLRAVTEIKGKYATDSTLSPWDISVTCRQGHVNLSGSVASPEDIGRSVAIALGADGVRDVTSALTVKSKY